MIPLFSIAQDIFANPCMLTCEIMGRAEEAREFMSGSWQQPSLANDHARLASYGPSNCEMRGSAYEASASRRGQCGKLSLEHAHAVLTMSTSSN
mmetsp:Transcript_144713/g.269709  ORF Transcript_144713/g.269709 Transcript_144713/m.269709 type:complete len:94 (-) Transcript_144713:136-417(-)